MPKRIVVPGELVTTERKRLGENVYLKEGNIIATVVGLVNETDTTVSVVQLEGKYVPQEGDVVIGIVTDEKFSGYVVDINAFYHSYISKREISEMIKNHSVVSVKVARVNEINEVELIGPRVFFGGEVFEVSPVKVPRVIGKDGSMLNVLKAGTGSTIMVGRNGRIWAKGGNLGLLKEAVAKIDREAHLDNLTNRMTEFLEKHKEVNADKKGEKKEGGM